MITETLWPLPPTTYELAYLAAGILGARAWNVAKRLWLYRGEASPPLYNHRNWTQENGVSVCHTDWYGWAADIPSYLWSWLRFGFCFYDPSVANISRKSLLDWL